jgi:hexosaminidase
MKHFKLFFLAVAAIIAVSCNFERGEADYDVVPLPQSITHLGGEPFVLNSKTKIVYDANEPQMERNAAFLSEYIKQITGLKLKYEPADGSNFDNNIVISLTAEDFIKGDEGYMISIGKEGIALVGKSPAGVFYGIQTLRKALPIGKFGTVELPNASINDAPLFGYRGMHLDVSRHFFDKEFVKRYIDIIALHNINTFHWHLTDDQGWRVEIKKYPKLTEIGSMRSHTVVGKDFESSDETPHGGFYTQEDIKEVVAYAAERYITIIPEIDLPGHMLAALASYPELGCTGEQYEVWPRWGITEKVLCPGKDGTVQFLKDVMDEIMELFPSEYIHIGGDECPKDHWKVCPDCQARIKAEKLFAKDGHTAEQRLQSWLTSEIEKYINDHGRRIIGWDEILEGGLAPNATVMSWRGITGGVTAANMGHDVIMVPYSHFYFDYYQSEDRDNEPLAIGGFIPVEKVYEFNPFPEEVDPSLHGHILGVQANVWCEYIKTTDHVEYMALPRMAALSEVQWRPAEVRDYEDFLDRMEHHLALYDHLGYNYAKHIVPSL